MMQFTVALTPSEEGGYTAQCVEIPGAISQGDTEEEALANITEAIALILEVRREDARRLHGRIETVEVNA